MATPLARSRESYRLVFYGICRTSGRLRTRAFVADGASSADIERAHALAGEKLRHPRYVSATRSPGNGSRP